MEKNLISSVFGYRPGFGFFDDRDGPNAFATTAPIIPSQHGSVLFGTNLISEEFRDGSGLPFGGDTAIVGVMAHEWAHIAQFQRGHVGSGKSNELHSDFMAGWYLAMKLASGSRFPIQSLASSLFEKGDFNFNSPGHHGTPDERVDAMVSGYGAVFYERTTNFNQAYEKALQYYF